MVKYCRKEDTNWKQPTAGLGSGLKKPLFSVDQEHTGP